MSRESLQPVSSKPAPPVGESAAERENALERFAQDPLGFLLDKAKEFLLSRFSFVPSEDFAPEKEVQKGGPEALRRSARRFGEKAGEKTEKTALQKKSEKKEPEKTASKKGDKTPNVAKAALLPEAETVVRGGQGEDLTEEASSNPLTVVVPSLLSSEEASFPGMAGPPHLFSQKEDLPSGTPRSRHIEKEEGEISGPRVVDEIPGVVAPAVAMAISVQSLFEGSDDSGEVLLPGMGLPCGCLPEGAIGEKGVRMIFPDNIPLQAEGGDFPPKILTGDSILEWIFGKIFGEQKPFVFRGFPGGFEASGFLPPLSAGAALFSETPVAFVGAPALPPRTPQPAAASGALFHRPEPLWSANIRSEHSRKEGDEAGDQRGREQGQGEEEEENPT